MLSRLLGPEIHWWGALLAIAADLVAAGLAASLAAHVARRLLLRATRGRVEASSIAHQVNAVVRFVRGTVFLLVALALATPALEAAGARIEGGFSPSALASWVLRSGLRVVLIAVLAFVAIQGVSLFVSRFESELAQAGDPGERERAKRAKTLGDLIRNVADTLIVTVAVLMSLQEFQVNVVPILTGAGILGVAAGFGAQTLVRDFISGFFLILEDQARVGDFVTIGPTSGVVQAINLRTVVLRDVAGVVHVIPNGSVDRIANHTKDYSYSLVDLGVAYKEDTDQVIAVARSVAEELQRDATHGPSILAPLEVLGVDAFAESQVTIRMRIKTLPLKQWEVGREFRRRIKKAFDAQGIEIPFPQRVVHVRERKAAAP
jgi:small conductance mechanosensitive channel